MMPIHNLKARTLTDYNKDLGLEIKVRAKYEIYIRTGLMGWICLLPALPSARRFGGPHPGLAEPSRAISVDFTDMWIRPRMTRHGFASHIIFTECPGTSFPWLFWAGTFPLLPARWGSRLPWGRAQPPLGQSQPTLRGQPRLIRPQLFEDSAVTLL